MDRSWFVIHTQSAWEAKVCQAISEKPQLEAFLAMEERMVRHARREQLVKRPLYPMYVFAEFHLHTDDWEEILEIRGVLNILGIRKQHGIPTGAARARAPENSKPLPLPPGVVPALQAAMALGQGAILLKKPQLQRFNKDDKVKISDGPLAGYNGLVSFDRKTRVGVMLDMLGRQRVIPFPRESVALAC